MSQLVREKKTQSETEKETLTKATALTSTSFLLSKCTFCFSFDQSQQIRNTKIRPQTMGWLLVDALVPHHDLIQKRNAILHKINIFYSLLLLECLMFWALVNQWQNINCLHCITCVQCSLFRSELLHSYTPVTSPEKLKLKPEESESDKKKLGSRLEKWCRWPLKMHILNWFLHILLTGGNIREI